jgi:hypothetical protein
MANHGYINRSGKGITFKEIAHGLQKCYGLTWFLSWFLSLGGLFLIRQWGPISLSDVSRHGGVEHDASLAHGDARPGDDYAPLPLDKARFEEAMRWMSESGGGEIIDAADVARARVNREKYCLPLDWMHSEIARGEMGIALNTFNQPSANPFNEKQGIPVEWLREWLGSDRLPMRGTWKPDHRVGMLAVMKKSTDMRNAMKRIRKVEGDRASPGCLWTQKREDRHVVVRMGVNGDAAGHIRQESTISYASTSSTISGSGDDLLPSQSKGKGLDTLTEVNGVE